MVINRVRVLGSGPHNPTQFYWEYSPPPLRARTPIKELSSVKMAALYAPNDDDPSFFLNFFDHLRDFNCDEVIIGDFNLVFDLYIHKRAVSLKHMRN